jgi:dimethylamine--corrinoid protein Co-methyltransferase
MGKIKTRMGDGFPVEMSENQLMEDLTTGTEDAADRGKIDPLNKEELQYLFDLFASPYRFVSVEPGNEIVLSYDGGDLKIVRAAVNVHRIQSLQIHEKILGADTIELGHVDYSYKPVKPIVGTEQTALEQGLMVTHVPLFYGAMPNLGLYSQPDGPHPNPSELLPLGKIDAAFWRALKPPKSSRRNILISALNWVWPESSSLGCTAKWNFMAIVWPACIPTIR